MYSTHYKMKCDVVYLIFATLLLLLMTPPRICSKGRCKRVLPPPEEYSFKTCEQCREQGRRSMAKKKAERTTASLSPAPDASTTGSSDLGRGSSEGTSPEPANKAVLEPETAGEPKMELTMYEDRDSLMAAVREKMKGDIPLFSGGYLVAVDPCQSEREVVQGLAMEMWKVSGYRFK